MSFFRKMNRLILIALLTFLPAFSHALQSAIAYDKFGVFENIGAAKYRYRVVDEDGLKRMVLPGIYPNVERERKGPKFSTKELFQKSKVWMIPLEEALKFWSTFDPKCASDPRFTDGVRQYYYAQSLERAGRLREAIYAYYAVVVHFPGEQDPNRNWPTFWPAYLGVKAMDAIQYLTLSNPSLGMRYIGGDISVENGFNATESDDILRVWPGHLLTVSPENVLLNKTPEGSVTYARGSAKGVALARYKDGQWELRVDGKKFLVKGVNYFPPPAYASGDSDYWSKPYSDINSNGKADVWEVWMDGNRNDKKDESEPVMSDFDLMAMMGANTVRLDSRLADSAVLSKAHKKNGLRFFLGHSLGAEKSSSVWPPTEISKNYSDPTERARLSAEVEKLVAAHKNEPYVLGWYLGDGMSVSAIRSNPQAYYSFIDDLAQRIHTLDPNRPVVLVLNDLTHLDLVQKLVPTVDILGFNSYRGLHGFGKSFWKEIREQTEKPVLITAYGAPAYGAEAENSTAEEFQSLYHQQGWQDISFNTAGSVGQGNSLGGFAFEWLDGWWRALALPGLPTGNQQSVPETPGPFLDGNQYSEWYGVMSLGGNTSVPFGRQPRKVFWNYYKLWKAKTSGE